MKQSVRNTILGMVLAAPIILVVGALLFIYSGLYPIAASKPHLGVVRWALTTLQERAVVTSADEIEPPPLSDAALIRRGLVQYQELCLVCHGAPGVARGEIGRGLNPNPPRLTVEVRAWNNAELYWIIANGLKMAGMPAFETGRTEEDLWAMVAFVRRLPQLSQEEYLAMVATVDEPAAAPEVEWVAEDDGGVAHLLAEGDLRRGEALIADFGCGACHVIPGVNRAIGKVGPPLTRFAERHFIAGSILNTPENLTAWITNPGAIEPGTAMPALGVSAEQALDMAAYLYTLGTPPTALEPLLGELR